MNSRSRIITLIALVLFLSAESNEISHKWQWEGLQAFQVKFSPSFQSQSNNNATTIMQTNLYVQLPIIVKNGNYLGSGLIYRGISFDFHNGSAPQLRPKISHKGQIILAYSHRFNESYYLYAEYNGGINGLWDDKENAPSHLMFFYLGHNRSDMRFFRIGVALASAFDKLSPYPILGASLGLTDRFALELLVPQHIIVRYRFTTSFETGAKLSYQLAHSGFKDSQNKRALDVTYSRIAPSLYLDYRVIKNLIVRIETGAYLLRNTTIRDIEKNSTLLDEEPAPILFTSLSLRLQV